MDQRMYNKANVRDSTISVSSTLLFVVKYFDQLIRSNSVKIEGYNVEQNITTQKTTMTMFNHDSVFYLLLKSSPSFVYLHFKIISCVNNLYFL
jgi:hypothetical protein